jgi:hypothetical protein
MDTEELFQTLEPRLRKQPQWVRDLVTTLRNEIRHEARRRQKLEDDLGRLTGAAVFPDSTMSIRFADDMGEDHVLEIPPDAIVLANINGDQVDLRVEDGELHVQGGGDLYARPWAPYEVIIGSHPKESK